MNFGLTIQTARLLCKVGPVMGNILSFRKGTKKTEDIAMQLVWFTNLIQPCQFVGFVSLKMYMCLLSLRTHRFVGYFDFILNKLRGFDDKKNIYGKPNSHLVCIWFNFPAMENLVPS